MNRNKLFKIQGWLSISLILIATISYALEAGQAETIKVAMAPFGAISALLFAFFIYSKQRRELDDNQTFSILNILLKTMVVAVAGAVVVFLTSYLVELTSSLDRTIFSFSIMIAAVVFINEKLRDFTSMAILTGIGEGVTVLMLFFK